MDILQHLSNQTAWVKLFRQKQAYHEGLCTDTIKLQEKQVAERKTLLDFAQENFNREQAKLLKYREDKESLDKWIPENQAKFDELQILLSDKVQKLAEKVRQAQKALPDEPGQNPAVL